jgi:hypothetical protein
VRPLLLAIALLVLFGSSACSVGVLSLVGDKPDSESTSVVATSHPDEGNGPGEITVFLDDTSDPQRSKLVTASVDECWLPYKETRIVPITDKHGPLASTTLYERIEVQLSNTEWQEVAEIETPSHPPSTGAVVTTSIMLPFALAFDAAFFPIEVWAAVFVKFIWPKGAFKN